MNKIELEKFFKQTTKKTVLECLSKCLYIKDLWKLLRLKPLRRGRNEYKKFESYYDINIIETIKQNQLKHNNDTRLFELTKIRICKNPDCKKEFTWQNHPNSNFCTKSCAAKYASSFVDSKNISNGCKQKTRIKTCSKCGKQYEDFCSTRKKIFICDNCIKALYNITGICPICGKTYDIRTLRKTCCKQHGKLLSARTNKATQSIRHTTGGVRTGAGRGKHGWYKGFWCDSSWELAYVIYNLDHEIEFKRYNGFFNYKYNGKIYKYYPDFVLNDGTIVEIKGYETMDKWQSKLQQFPSNKKLIVINKKTIKPYLDYVIQKYGENFTTMYEK